MFDNEDEQYPEVFQFFVDRGTIGRTVTSGKDIPSRMPVAFDVLITGTATVNIYASNIFGPASGSHWGAPIKVCTASEKVIFENEPWKFWMVEVSSIISGTVTVMASA